MEKNNKAKLGALIATALMAPIAANANQEQSTPERPEQEMQAQKALFIPVEELSPKQRALVFEKLRLISTLVEIDWESVLVGVNEKGQIILKGKKADDLQILGNPTCWAEL